MVALPATLPSGLIALTVTCKTDGAERGPGLEVELIVPLTVAVAAAGPDDPPPPPPHVARAREAPVTTTNANTRNNLLFIDCPLMNPKN